MPQPVYTVRLGEEIGNRDIGNNEESPEAQRQLGLVGKPEKLACRSCSGNMVPLTCSSPECLHDGY
jgi:hypothetical protein